MITKYTTPRQIAKTVEAGMLEDFLIELSKNLMLDDLLMGECDPVAFLKEQINSSAIQVLINRTKERLSRLDDGKLI